MKSIISKYAIELLVLVFLASYNEVLSQQSRGVDWVYGLGGDANSLKDDDDFYFSERRILGPNRNSYPTDAGIQNMAGQVYDKTEGGGTRLAIGHSLGGTAVREVSLWNGAYWHGVITMGSPLRGAQISTSASDGTNSAFVGNGTAKLMAGPNVGSAVSPPILPGLGIEFLTLGAFGPIYSQSISNWMNNKLMGKFGLVGQTALDLKPGSPYQIAKAGQSSYVPKILIWGSEVYPLLWRVVGTYALWDSETNGVNLAGDIGNIYNAAVNGEEFQSWVNFPMHGFHQWRKGKWEQGRDWVNTDSNTGWSHVIGATYTEYVSWYETVVTCDSYQWQACYGSSPPPGYCDDYCTDQVFHSYVLYHNLPSDGVVTSESQKNIGGSWQGYPLEAPGVNHGEFKFPDRVKDALNWVFDGNHNSTVFRIDRR